MRESSMPASALAAARTSRFPVSPRTSSMPTSTTSSSSRSRSTSTRSAPRWSGGTRWRPSQTRYTRDTADSTNRWSCRSRERSTRPASRGIATRRGADTTSRSSASVRRATGYPDFLVWKGKDVFALDTTGGHLLKEKTGRKLLSIEPAKATSGRLIVRLISEGQWNPDVEQEDSAGYTVWGRKQDNTLRATHVDSVDAAVERSVTKTRPSAR